MLGGAGGGGEGVGVGVRRFDARPGEGRVFWRGGSAGALLGGGCGLSDRRVRWESVALGLG